MLANGNIYLFDNGYTRGFSRVIELNPLTKKIVWEYKGDPPQSFHSQSRGSAQHLPNGNILIGEAKNGRAFEVTKEGEIVWEWFSPWLNEAGARKAFYRMTRYPKEKIERILSDNKASPIYKSSREWYE